MKSITFCIGYLLAVLVVDVSSVDDYYILDVPKTTHNIPYNFGYSMKYGSLLIMEITLKNIPPCVTAVNVTQSTRAYYTEFTATTGKVNVDKETREGKYMILTHLRLLQIWVDVQLYKGGRLCTGKRIAEGRDMPSASGAYYWDTTQKALLYYTNWIHDGSGVCFAPQACEIILDLKDTCKEQPKSTYGENVECRVIESQYICTFVRAENNNNELVLSQIYEDDSVIGPKWEIKKATIKLSIKLELELFDNNTLVKLASVKWPGTIRTLRSNTLSITAQDISKASNVTTLRYTNTTDVQFSCEQPKPRSTKIEVWLGFINTTDNTITTHNTLVMIGNKFMMADNGTMLCCIVYEFKKDGQEMNIARFVKNKTLLIYQTQELTSVNLTESSEQKKVPCQDVWWLYLLLALLGTIILLLTLYIVIKQRLCTKSQPAEETVELDNYATTNQVLYVNLDFVHNESRAENQTEESPYANIVGVLHPL